MSNDMYVSINVKELEKRKKAMVERTIEDTGEADQKRMDNRTGDFDFDVSIEDADGLLFTISTDIFVCSFTVDSIHHLTQIASIIRKQARALTGEDK